VGLPFGLLERRPDVRMAEQNVRAANAKIGVAVGDFFPRIGLIAFYGGSRTDLDKLGIQCQHFVNPRKHGRPGVHRTPA